MRLPARTQCLNNLKQIGLGLQNHHDVFKKLPAGGAVMAADDEGLSFHVYILPFIEESTLYAKFNRKLGFDNAANLRRAEPGRCLFLPQRNGGTQRPLSRRDFGRHGRLYDALLWRDGPQGQQSQRRGLQGEDGQPWRLGSAGRDDGQRSAAVRRRHRRHVEDIRRRRNQLDRPAGLDHRESQLVSGLVARANTTNSGADAGPSAGCKIIQDGLGVTPYDGAGNFNQISFGSMHPGGAQFLFVDGSATFVADTIDLAVYKAAASRDGGEALQMP